MSERDSRPTYDADKEADTLCARLDLDFEFNYREVIACELRNAHDAGRMGRPLSPIHTTKHVYIPRERTIVECLLDAASQIPNVDDSGNGDEYRRGQKRGAQDCVRIIRRLLNNDRDGAVIDINGESHKIEQISLDYDEVIRLSKVVSERPYITYSPWCGNNRLGSILPPGHSLIVYTGLQVKVGSLT